MLKMVVSVVLSGFVLSSGLVSCAPDGNKNVVKDVYKAKAPKIQRASGDVVAMTKGVEVPSLDLRDAFDFSESAPTHVLITSTCRIQGDKYISESEFSGQRKILIYQTIKPEISNRDFKTENIECAFKFNLFNKAGSNNISDLDYLPLTDKNPSKITIERAGKIENQFSSDQIADVNVRYSEHATVEASLECRDVTFEPIKLTTLLPMSSINWARPIPRNEKEPNAYKARSPQRCRILVKANEELLDLSEPLDVRFALEPLTASIVPSSYDPAQPVGPGQFFNMMFIRLTNPEPIARVVRYTTRRYNVQSEVYVSNQRFISFFLPNYSYVGLVSLEESDGRVIEIVVPPKGHFDVPVSFRYNNPLNCVVPSHGHSLHLSDSVIFSPVNPTGQLETQITVSNLPTVWGAKNPGLNPALYTRGSNNNPNVPGPLCLWR